MFGKKNSRSSASRTTIQHAEDEIEPVHTADLPTNLAENVSYGPSGVKGMISSPYVFGAAFLTSLGAFSFGYGEYS